MKTVYECLLNGRLYTGTKEQLSEQIGYSFKHIKEIGEVEAIGYMLAEYKVLDKRRKKIVTGHIYDIARVLQIKPESVRGYNPTATGNSKFMTLKHHEQVTRESQRKKSDLPVGDVKMIVGRMKYLNNKGFEPEWVIPKPMQRELEKLGISYEEVKEVEC